jgi:MFS family permease
VHLQTTLRISPLDTGLAFLPLAIGFAAASLASPRLPHRVSRTLIPVGLLLCVMAFPMLGSIIAAGHHPGVAVYLLFGLIGVGQGFAITPVMGLALSRVPQQRAGEASGVLSCTFQIAQVIGVAGLGSVFLSDAAGAGTASATRLTCLLITAGLVLGLLAARNLLRVTR